MHRSLILACLGLGLGIAAVAACSGSNGSDITSGGDAGGDGGASAEGGGSGPSQSQAASDLAHAVCQRFQACAPAYINIAYGTVAECEKRFTMQYAAGLAADGSNQTTSQVEACVAAAPSISCTDLLGRKTPDVCKSPAGQLADGKACGTDSQCANKRCIVAPGTTCGTCSSPVQANQACGKDDDCDDGLKCVNSTCVPLGATGAACDTGHPCNPTFACVGGSCVAAQAEGAKCTTSAECDELHGIFCDGKKCQTLQFAALPAPCGVVDGGLQLCNGPASCVTTSPGMGTCTAAPADNTSCVADGGASCESPSVCQNGTCVFPLATACK